MNEMVYILHIIKNILSFYFILFYFFYFNHSFLLSFKVVDFDNPERRPGACVESCTLLTASKSMTLNDGLLMTGVDSTEEPDP